jgi:hypothetical protein
MSRAFRRTYELDPAAPPAWDWNRYEQHLQGASAELLACGPSEAEVHRFLELHPCMLPGGEGGCRLDRRPSRSGSERRSVRA